MEALLGEQREVVQNTLAKRTPSAATRSNWGVRRVGCPAQLSAFQRRSSQRMKSTLGLSAAVTFAAGSKPAMSTGRKWNHWAAACFMELGEVALCAAKRKRRGPAPGGEWIA